MTSSKKPLNCSSCVVTPKKVQTQNLPNFYRNYKTLRVSEGLNSSLALLAVELWPNMYEPKFVFTGL